MTELLNKNMYDFTGGLNYTDSELNMKDNMFTTAKNVELVYDSTIKKRNGFKLVTNMHSHLLADEVIQEIFYFQLHVLVYTNKGRIFAIDGQNNVELIWDSAIASTLPGSPTIWQNPTARCYGTPANKWFVLSNGYDKPLAIDLYPDGEDEVKCMYLSNAKGSNANVPVFLKARMVNHYLCAFKLDSTELYISAKDNPGVWEADDDGYTAGAINYHIGSVVGITNQNIVDIATYKNQLCVITDYHIIILDLDQYVENSQYDSSQTISRTNMPETHTPTVSVCIDNAGCSTIGSVQSTMQTLLFLSMNGLNEVERNAVSQNFVPISLSEKVLPYLKSHLTSDIVNRGIVSFVDRQKYVYGLKFGEEVLCMSFHPNLSDYCFWIWDKITYNSFVNNVYGRVLAADDRGVYIYSDDAEDYCIDDHIMSDGSVYHTTYKMEVVTPWFAFSKSNNVKTMEYFNIVTDGTARFNVNYTNDLETEWQLTEELLGGSKKGYGSPNQYYGGGLISSTEYLIDFPNNFMYARFGFESEDDQPLRIIRYGVFYKVGGIRR